VKGLGKVETLSEGRIGLSWGVVDCPKCSFDLFCTKEGGKPVVIKGLMAKFYSFLDQNKCTGYQFVVMAKNDCGYGKASKPLFVEKTCPTPPILQLLPNLTPPESVIIQPQIAELKPVPKLVNFINIPVKKAKILTQRTPLLKMKMSSSHTCTVKLDWF